MNGELQHTMDLVSALGEQLALQKELLADLRQCLEKLNEVLEQNA